MIPGADHVERRLHHAFRIVGVLLVVAGCSCADDDPGTGAVGDSDTGVDAALDSAVDADTDVGDAGDAGDAGGSSSSPDGGDPLPSGWSTVDDVVEGARGLRVAMRGAPDGRVVVVFKDTSDTESLRAMRWHGGESGSWTDLGVVNQGVAGTLETGADPEFRFVGIGLLAGSRVLVAFRQGGAIHANVFDGTSFGEPRLVSSSPSALALASDGDDRAFVAYATSGSRVAVRFYDATSDTFGPESVVDSAGRVLETPDRFVVLAGLSDDGDALVASVDRPGTSSYRVVTSRYVAADAEWTEESSAPFVSSFEPARLCLAMNDDGVAVFSLAERFTTMFGTFVRTRAARREAGAVAWGTWSTFDGVAMHDACATSADGTSLVVTLVPTGTGADLVPHRFTGGLWSTSASVGAVLTTGSSRALVAMASGGRATVAYQRRSDELRLTRFDGEVWSSAPDLVVVNPTDTNLDQFFKGSVALDDGRALWVHQDSQGRLRYLVHR